MSGSVEDIFEDELGPTIQRLVQAAAFNARERIICTHLIESINSEPLLAVQHVCRAVLLIPDAIALQLKILKPEVVEIYQTAQILGSPTVDSKGVYSVNLDSLPWNSIKQWALMRSSFYAHKALHQGTEFNRAEYEEYLDSLSDEERFRVIDVSLIESGYKHLVSDFLMFAVTKTCELSSKLSEIISPAVYQETFKAITSAKEMAEK